MQKSAMPRKSFQPIHRSRLTGFSLQPPKLPTWHVFRLLKWQLRKQAWVLLRTKSSKITTLLNTFIINIRTQKPAVWLKKIKHTAQWRLLTLSALLLRLFRRQTRHQQQYSKPFLLSRQETASSSHLIQEQKNQQQPLQKSFLMLPLRQVHLKELFPGLMHLHLIWQIL